MCVSEFMILNSQKFRHFQTHKSKVEFLTMEFLLAEYIKICAWCRSFFQDLHTKRQFSKLILSKNSKIDSEICCSPRLFVIISMMYVYDSINVQFATTRQTILENVDQNNAFLKSFRSENQILITGKTKYACACSYRPRCNFIEVLK